jgi:hypothetical protein
MMDSKDKICTQLREWAQSIDNDGTSSQAGPSAQELRDLATTISESSWVVVHPNISRYERLRQIGVFVSERDRVRRRSRLTGALLDGFIDEELRLHPWRP